MFYVIALERVTVTKSFSETFQEGRIISRHKSEDTAAERWRTLQRKADHPDRIAMVDAPYGHAAGDIVPELVKQATQERREKLGLSLARDLILQERGTPIEKPDFFASWLEDLGLSVDELCAEFGARAAEKLDEETAKRQAFAERMARINAIEANVSERSEVTFSFPAVKGIQAGNEFYTAQIPFKYLVKLFRFDEDTLPPEARAQRNLNESHAKDIADYILENRHEYVLPAITASVSAEMAFEGLQVSGAGARVGVLHIPMDAVLLINDGQHRRRGIELALQSMPLLGEETVCVTLFFDQGLKRSQQMFADINANAKKPSSSLSALYDQRDPFNGFVLELLKELPDIRSRIEFESGSVGPKSFKLWNLVSFKKFISNLTNLNKRSISDYDEVYLRDAAEGVKLFLEKARAHVPMWDLMLSGKISAQELREQYVVGHAVFLEALGLYGTDIVNKYLMYGNQEGMDRFEAMQKLESLVPERTAPVWEGRCVVAGRMQKTSDGVKGTAATLMGLCGMSPTPTVAETEMRLGSLLN